ncbi:hypothetical protein Smp_178180, partial [Schistosoma mansoni]|uniref:hypothetical protein n=1 Tax=Schistosoma mansoni TaxID=6183 RepID=UPI00022C8540
LSKFARLARSVTRNRSVLQQLSASQTSTQNSALTVYRKVSNQMEQYNSPSLSNFQNLNTSSSSRFHDSSKSDPEKAVMVSNQCILCFLVKYRILSAKCPFLIL